MKIVVTRLMPEAGLDVLRKEAEVDIWPGPENVGSAKTEIIKGVKKADVWLPLLTETIDRGIMGANPRLLAIGFYHPLRGS